MSGNNSCESKSTSSFKTWTFEDCKNIARSAVSKLGLGLGWFLCSGITEQDIASAIASALADHVLVSPPQLESNYERTQRPNMMEMEEERDDEFTKEKEGDDDDEFYIAAAFRSVHNNEVFVFTGDVKYFVFNEKEKRVTKAPLMLVDGFYELYATDLFPLRGVYAAFGCHATNEAFLFVETCMAKIRYDDNNEGEVLQLDLVAHLFRFLKDTKFYGGRFDAACESPVRVDEAYLFMGFDFALINYSKLTLIKTGRITDEFSCLRGTAFASKIGSAFASHEFNNGLYLFKGKSYVLIELDSTTTTQTQSRIISGPDEISPTNWPWPCLQGLIPPWKKGKQPPSTEPETWLPAWDFYGQFRRVPLDTDTVSLDANASLERTRSTDKRKAEEDYGIDATSAGNYAIKRTRMEDKMQRRPQYNSRPIAAAFRSTRVNEVFMFSGCEYFVVKHDVDSQEWKYVTKSSVFLSDALKELGGSRFETVGVDAAFGCHGSGTAFLFSGRCMAKIEYDDRNIVRLVEAFGDEYLVSIPWFAAVFGVEDKELLFCEGYLDAACDSNVPGEAYFFKGSGFALINYADSTLIRKGRITDEFPCLQNTAFGTEIGCAFAASQISSNRNQLYFFNGNTYVIIGFETDGSSFLVAGPEIIEPDQWPCLGLVPI